MTTEPEYFPEYSLAEPMYLEAKKLFLMVQDLSMAARASVFYNNDQLKKHEDVIRETQRKLTKLQEFVQQTYDTLIDTHVKIDDKESQMQAQFTPKPQEKKRHDRTEEDQGQVARKHDRVARSTEGRKDATRKPFSLASTMASNRVRP